MFDSYNAKGDIVACIRNSRLHAKSIALSMILFIQMKDQNLYYLCHKLVIVSARLRCAKSE